ncbi:hypothetical protein [Aliiroseovarius sp.]|uniref:hypothetical protein n=1 Tax=Aliiroseovarius sp. TaxID=1872442 RepID=UPI003BA9B661
MTYVVEDPLCPPHDARDSQIPEPDMTLPRLTALIALIAAPALAEPVVLTDEAAFRAYAVDRPMGFGIGDQVIHADGTVTGEVYGPGKFTGTWAWREGFYCRVLDMGGEVTPEDCMVVQKVDEETMRMVRERGEGRTYEFTFK